MIRVIVDSQSNRLFREVLFEQSYDQRGGLCEVGSEGIVITTNPIDPEYLRYWHETLGLDLPRLLTVGPFDPSRTLSELLLWKPDRQAALHKMLAGETARLEFFCIEESERALASTLGTPAYCSFDVAIPFSRKSVSKNLFDELGIPSPAWSLCVTKEEFLSTGKTFLEQYGPFLLKATDGTGGFTCGGMFSVRTLSDLERLASQNGLFPQESLIEEVIPSTQTLSVHWEIPGNGLSKIVGIFQQKGEYAYSGASWPAATPTALSEQIKDDVSEKIVPKLIQMGAIGFFCADIVVDDEGRGWWVDFNPRKGAILYVYNMVRRLSARHFGSAQCKFLHEHLHLPARGASSFSAIEEALQDLLLPQEQFAVVTNPGVIPFGYVDITGISTRSLEKARSAFEKARERLFR